jgi:hypothetical protein
MTTVADIIRYQELTAVRRMRVVAIKTHAGFNGRMDVGGYKITFIMAVKADIV